MNQREFNNTQDSLCSKEDDHKRTAKLYLHPNESYTMNTLPQKVMIRKAHRKPTILVLLEETTGKIPQNHVIFMISTHRLVWEEIQFSCMNIILHFVGH